MVRILNQYVSPKGVVLMLMEGVFIALALLCAVRIRFWGSEAGFEEYVRMPEFGWQALVFVATLQVCFYYCDLYRFSTIRARNEQFISLGQSLGSGCLLLGILYFIFPACCSGAAYCSSAWRWCRRSSSEAGRRWTVSGRRPRPRKKWSLSAPESWRKRWPSIFWRGAT